MRVRGAGQCLRLYRIYGAQYRFLFCSCLRCCCAVAASAVTGVADEIITTLYTELSLAAPTTTLLAACQGFDCEYHTGVALTDAGRVKLAELVASGRGSPGLFSPR